MQVILQTLEGEVCVFGRFVELEEGFMKELEEGLEVGMAEVESGFEWLRGWRSWEERADVL